MSRKRQKMKCSYSDREDASDLRDCAARLIDRLEVLLCRMAMLGDRLDSLPERIASSIRLIEKQGRTRHLLKKGAKS